MLALSFRVGTTTESFIGGRVYAIDARTGGEPHERMQRADYAVVVQELTECPSAVPVFAFRSVGFPSSIASLSRGVW